MRRAVLTPSPRGDKKWRVALAGGSTFDFGQAGAADYTTHGDARRAARYLRRHGGLSKEEYAALKTSSSLQAVKRAVARVDASTKEDWHDPTTRGFWSRWLLWSQPTLAQAQGLLRRRFGIEVVVEDQKKRSRRK